MGEEQQTTTSQQSSERFLSILKELERIKDAYAVQVADKYRKMAMSSSLRFRLSGVLIIGLSVSLPFLSTLKGFWTTSILPLVALMVAGLSGLTSFFRWESNWKGFSQTRYELEHMLKVWELKIIEAKYEINEQKAIDIALQATKQLLDDTRITTNAEAEEFFQRVQIPKS